MILPYKCCILRVAQRWIYRSKSHHLDRKLRILFLGDRIFKIKNKVKLIFFSFKSKNLPASITMWEIEESVLAFIASPSNHIRSAHTRSVVQVALQISSINSSAIASTFLASNNLVKSESIWNALIAFLASNSWWTNTFSSFFLANGS